MDKWTKKRWYIFINHVTYCPLYAYIPPFPPSLSSVRPYELTILSFTTYSLFLLGGSSGESDRAGGCDLAGWEVAIYEILNRPNLRHASYSGPITAARGNK